ncbi:MAG: hypothetical protein KKD18_00960 [Nanoarchaeota archaeon]|nr:hypothetical protein [Nanoarchaeota archaeon]MBU0976964.1 hypothetical protein [Nanoarchaeota archaeon]
MVCFFENETDAGELAAIYKTVPHEGLSFSPLEFAHAVGGRIYTEWCMSPESRGQDRCYNYQGQAFQRFVADETHYEGLRRAAAGEGDVWAPEVLLQRRRDVLVAFTLRAVKFFQETGGKSARMMDRENLRCDLEPWLALRGHG